MVDVLRGALAEVEDYTRVTVVPVAPASLLGRAVGDVIHLLAELIENAVSFSPPQTAVRVGGSVVGNGFAIEIEDRGLGMTPQEREAANEQLRNPPEFKLTSTARLGLYVVGKLAERHGIRVRLTESPYGGTTAIVLLPSTLIADEPDDLLRIDAGQLEPSPASQPGGGRHRNDGPALAVPSAVRGAVEEAPVLNHVMQAGLASAVPAIPTRGPGVADVVHASTVDASTVDSFAVDPFSVDSVAVDARAVEQMPTRRVPQQPTWPMEPSVWAPPPPVPPQPVPPAPAGPIAPTAAPTARRPRRLRAPTMLTPSGLPWRQRPAPDTPVTDAAPMTPVAPITPTAPPAPSTAPGNGHPGQPGQPGQPDAAPLVEVGPPRPVRGLEETRSLMASYRSGTMRGRTEAARLAEANNHHTPEWTQPAQESVGSEDGG